MKPESDVSLPSHVAVIMDGNNRWARARGLSVTAGHRAGAETARDLVDACLERGIGYLTLFAFSSENWLRPSSEVRGLMSLFLAVLKRKEIEHFHERNVRIRFIGNRAGFSRKLQDHMLQVEERTGTNTGLIVTVAADYGGRWDIVQATRKICADVKAGNLLPDEVTEQTVHEAICLGDQPSPDLCIRTGGEHRISNFLLWQFAYTELYFTERFWPDFDAGEFQRALDDYSSRQRRFGRHTEASVVE